MNLKGHVLYRIGDEWLFDVTDCIGYRVYKNKNGNTVQKYEIAFKININNDTYDIRYRISTPFGVARKAINLLRKYRIA